MTDCVGSLCSSYYDYLNRSDEYAIPTEYVISRYYGLVVNNLRSENPSDAGNYNGQQNTSKDYHKSVRDKIAINNAITLQMCQKNINHDFVADIENSTNMQMQSDLNAPNPDANYKQIQSDLKLEQDNNQNQNTKLDNEMIKADQKKEKKVMNDQKNGYYISSAGNDGSKQLVVNSRPSVKKLARKLL